MIRLIRQGTRWTRVVAGSSAYTSADPTSNRLIHWAKSCSYRHFIVSEKGYFSLAPESVQVGDEICILIGSKTPYIIRKKINNDEPFCHRVAVSECYAGTAHAFIGEAYVHGIMNGEGM